MAQEEVDTATEEPAEEIVDARECPALFGDRESREDNAEKRKSCLDSVRVSKYTISLIHHCDWTEPQYVHLTGLDLENIDCPAGLDEEAPDDCDPVAHLRLVEEMDAVECKPGVYSLRVDDNLGEDGRVLAILPDLILTEFQGCLYYLPLDPMARPVWRIIWRSPWKILRLPDRRTNTRTSRRSHRSKHRSRYKRR